MIIARLNGSTIGEMADHRSLFPKVSFPPKGPNADWLAANSCAEVVRFLAFDSATQRSDVVTPYLSGGKVYTRQVVDLTAAEQAAVVTAANDELAINNRAERDRRLAKTDWTANSDVTMSAAMTTYRQELRDITNHANWPNLVYPDIAGNGGDWPQEPTT